MFNFDNTVSVISMPIFQSQFSENKRGFFRMVGIIRRGNLTELIKLPKVN